jgi:hypothetical protein
MTAPGNPVAPGTANFAFGAIVFAFIVYITAKGELATYIKMFFYAAPQVPLTGAALTTSAQNAQTQSAIAGQTGPTPVVPNVAPGQSSTITNNFLNGIFGPPAAFSGNSGGGQ